jgi:hypothetical protein
MGNPDSLKRQTIVNSAPLIKQENSTLFAYAAQIVRKKIGYTFPCSLEEEGGEKERARGEKISEN